VIEERKHLHLEIANEGRLKTKLYDKRDYFTFPIVNFPFGSSNIPSSPAYVVYTSQLIRYSRAYAQYSTCEGTDLLILLLFHFDLGSNDI
jgi:hypothetical protein